MKKLLLSFCLIASPTWAGTFWFTNPDGSITNGYISNQGTWQAYDWGNHQSFGGHMSPSGSFYNYDSLGHYSFGHFFNH